jgi:hypothetical protein
MDQRARLKINLARREFEVEGSEAFVRAYAERFEDLLNLMTVAPPTAEELPAPADAVDAQAQSSKPSLGNFGEFIQSLPRSSTDVDKLLAAGFFAQSRSADNAFSTGDANTLLIDQGIKVGNPSQCVKQNLNARRVFQLQRGRYRVSQPGVDYLRQLLGAAFPAVSGPPYAGAV